MSLPVPEVWKIDFYTGDDGSLPVRAWLDTVPQDVRGKVLARIELLRTGGPTLDYPYTSQIEGKLGQASGRQDPVSRLVLLRRGPHRHPPAWLYQGHRSR